MEERPVSGNYIRNIKTSKARTVRVEVVGEVDEAENQFLNSVSYFVAGTLGRDDAKHTAYVAQLMVKLIKNVLAHVLSTTGIKSKTDRDANKEKNSEKNGKFIRNIKTSKQRTVRVEIVGVISESERNFLDGCAYFMAGTMTRNNQKHTEYVTGLMANLVREVVAKIQKDKEEGK